MVVMTMDMVAVIHLRNVGIFPKCKIPAWKRIRTVFFSGFPARIPEGIVWLSAVMRFFRVRPPPAVCSVRPAAVQFPCRSDRDVPRFPVPGVCNKETFSIFVCGNSNTYFLYGKFVRYLKKEIDYRLEEVVFDCDMAICFQPSKEKEILK